MPEAFEPESTSPRQVARVAVALLAASLPACSGEAESEPFGHRASWLSELAVESPPRAGVRRDDDDSMHEPDLPGQSANAALASTPTGSEPTPSCKPWRWFGAMPVSTSRCPSPSHRAPDDWQVSQPLASLGGELGRICAYQWVGASAADPAPDVGPDVGFELVADHQSFNVWGEPEYEGEATLDVNLARLGAAAFLNSLEAPLWSRLPEAVRLSPGVFAAQVDAEQSPAVGRRSLVGNYQHRDYSNVITERVACDQGRCAWDWEFFTALRRTAEGLRGGGLDVAAAAVRAHDAAAARGQQAVIAINLSFNDPASDAEPSLTLLRRVLEQLACAGDLLIAAGGNRGHSVSRDTPVAYPAEWHDTELSCEGVPQGRPLVLAVVGVNARGVPLASTVNPNRGLRAPGYPAPFVVGDGADALVMATRNGSSYANVAAVASTIGMSVVRPEASPVQLGAILLDHFDPGWGVRAGRDGSRGGVAPERPVLTACGALAAACERAAASTQNHCDQLATLCPEREPAFAPEDFWRAVDNALDDALDNALDDALDDAVTRDPASGRSGFAARASEGSGPARGAGDSDDSGDVGEGVQVACGSAVPARDGGPGFPKGFEAAINSGGTVLVTALDSPIAQNVQFYLLDANGNEHPSSTFQSLSLYQPLDVTSGVSVVSGHVTYTLSTDANPTQYYDDLALLDF